MIAHLDGTMQRAIPGPWWIRIARYLNLNLSPRHIVPPNPPRTKRCPSSHCQGNEGALPFPVSAITLSLYLLYCFSYWNYFVPGVSLPYLCPPSPCGYFFHKSFAALRTCGCSRQRCVHPHTMFSTATFLLGTAQGCTFVPCLHKMHVPQSGPLTC